MPKPKTNLLKRLIYSLFRMHLCKTAIYSSYVSPYYIFYQDAVVHTTQMSCMVAKKIFAITNGKKQPIFQK